MFDFKNPQTKASYRPLEEKDREIYQPAGKGHGSYQGMLSGISPAIAESMLSQQTNLLERIEKTTNPAKPAAVKTGAEA